MTREENCAILLIEQMFFNQKRGFGLKERIILHCDLNNYFASVESIGHPEYKEIPMAVCGRIQERHGIILAKNELAKKAGIKTAMPVNEARRLCPELFMVPPHYDRYMEYSRKVQEIYVNYTNQVEPFGIDECWLDVTGSTLLFGSGEEIANRLRKEVKEKFGLTISVGVSFCKILAKLGSDLNKPDGITVITKADLPEKVWQLSVGSLFGIGGNTVEKLRQIGIYTIGQLALASPVALQSRFGKNGVLWWQFANGLEYSPVANYGETALPKSVSRSTTCLADLTKKEQVRQVLVGLTGEVSSELRRYGLVASTVSVNLRDTTLSWTGRQQTLITPTRLVKPLVEAAMELVEKHWNKQPLRSLGIAAQGLIWEGEPVQTGLFYDIRKLERGERLEQQVDKLNQQMGERSVCRASQLLYPLQVKLGSSFGHIQF